MPTYFPTTLYIHLYFAYPSIKTLLRCETKVQKYFHLLGSWVLKLYVMETTKIYFKNEGR